MQCIHFRTSALALFVGTALGIGSAPSSAGVIISVPSATGAEGFGGWELGNVVVEVPGGSFDEATGAYVIGPDGTFNSLIEDGTGTQTAVVHGKDWPVGEPAGIKIVNDDLAVKSPKPTNCIMTTSYLELPDELDSGYLDTLNPVQTLCSSGFQTHKRFKVNMEANSTLPGAGVDLVFNVQADGSERSYQVFQKINNYTGVRLEGFSVELGVGIGSTFVAAGDAGLTDVLSLAIPLTTDDPDNGIWDPQDIATFSHGLFGPADAHFPEDGFFDNQRAGFFVEIEEYLIGSGLGDAFHSVATQGSNYAQVPPVVGPPEQFGPWLPSEWIPHGVFFDDDGDPNTDAILKAFWGETEAGSGNFAWMLGDAAGFAEVDAATLQTWLADPAYSVGEIEDLLNLALNYLVNLGTVDANWPTWDDATSTATFTLRIAPVADTSGLGAPAYVQNPPPPFTAPGVAGTIAVSPSPEFLVTDTLSISLADADLNLADDARETVDVSVSNLTTGETETLILTETEADRAVFEATIDTAYGTDANPLAGILHAAATDVVEVTYNDANAGSGPAVVSASSTARGGISGTLIAAAEVEAGSALAITLTDADLNTRTAAIDFGTVSITNERSGEVELYTLAETGIDSGVFSGELSTLDDAASGSDSDHILHVQATDLLTVSYLDVINTQGDSEQTSVQSAVTAAPATDDSTDNDAAAPAPVETEETTTSSSGGGCTLSRSNHFNATMPLVLAMLIGAGLRRFARSA